MRPLVILERIGYQTDYGGRLSINRLESSPTAYLFTQHCVSRRLYRRITYSLGHKASNHIMLSGHSGHSGPTPIQIRPWSHVFTNDNSSVNFGAGGLASVGFLLGNTTSPFVAVAFESKVIAAYGIVGFTKFQFRSLIPFYWTRIECLLIRQRLWSALRLCAHPIYECTVG